MVDAGIVVADVARVAIVDPAAAEAAVENATEAISLR